MSEKKLRRAKRYGFVEPNTLTAFLYYLVLAIIIILVIIL